MDVVLVLILLNMGVVLLMGYNQCKNNDKNFRVEQEAENIFVRSR
jgi:hypothetical protein